MSCKPARRGRHEVTGTAEQLAVVASLDRVPVNLTVNLTVAAVGECHREPPSSSAPNTAVAAATALATRERRTERTEPVDSNWGLSLGAPRGRAETSKHGRLGCLTATSTSAATGMKASRVGSSRVGGSNGGSALGSGSRHGDGARSFKTKRLSSPATWLLPLTAWMGDPTTERGGGAMAGGGGGHLSAMMGAGLPLSLARSIEQLVPTRSLCSPAEPSSLAVAPGRARRG